MPIAAMAGATSERHVESRGTRREAPVREFHHSRPERPERPSRRSEAPASTSSTGTREFLQNYTKNNPGILYDPQGFDDLRAEHDKMSREFGLGSTRDLKPEHVYALGKAATTATGWGARLVDPTTTFGAVGMVTRTFMRALLTADWAQEVARLGNEGNTLFDSLMGATVETAKDLLMHDLWDDVARGFEKLGEGHSAEAPYFPF
jgi:hypothetical protein